MLSTAGCAVAQSSGPGVSGELLAKARAQGVVQVIVTMRVPPDAPAATVETVKRSVLDAIAATRHRIVYPLPNLPQVVLDASEDTLRLLGASPHVLRIQEPRLSRPSS
ncbi:MAG TPA: hypothetical protein VMQ51_15525 [Candidatus Binatia bacterium]|nr:hypothetical protein [Candidatus Binatia bacterium]